MNHWEFGKRITRLSFKSSWTSWGSGSDSGVGISSMESQSQRFICGFPAKSTVYTPKHFKHEGQISGFINSWTQSETSSNSGFWLWEPILSKANQKKKIVPATFIIRKGLNTSFIKFENSTRTIQVSKRKPTIDKDNVKTGPTLEDTRS